MSSRCNSLQMLLLLVRCVCYWCGLVASNGYCTRFFLCLPRCIHGGTPVCTITQSQDNDRDSQSQGQRQGQWRRRKNRCIQKDRHRDGGARAPCVYIYIYIYIYIHTHTYTHSTTHTRAHHVIMRGKTLEKDTELLQTYTYLVCIKNISPSNMACVTTFSDPFAWWSRDTTASRLLWYLKLQARSFQPISSNGDAFVLPTNKVLSLNHHCTSTGWFVRSYRPQQQPTHASRYEHNTKN